MNLFFAFQPPRQPNNFGCLRSVFTAFYALVTLVLGAGIMTVSRVSRMRFLSSSFVAEKATKIAFQMVFSVGGSMWTLALWFPYAATHKNKQLCCLLMSSQLPTGSLALAAMVFRLGV